MNRLKGIGPVVHQWSDSVGVTTNKNGKVGLCIDPKPLNRTLHRNHYSLPTIDGVISLLSKGHVFAVLDTKNGFWHIQFDEPSSLATTFVTPWGRNRWLRMPFGLSPTLEETQRRIDVALEGLPGQKDIAHDIPVFRSRNTNEEALKDHGRNLRKVLNRCQRKSIKLNADRMQFR